MAQDRNLPQDAMGYLAPTGVATGKLLPPLPAGTSDPVVEGEIPDQFLNGKPAQADIRTEYLSGGGRVFPLSGQVILANGGDDLSQNLGIEIYDTMLVDPTVWSAFFLLVSSVLSGKFQIVPKIKLEEGETETSLAVNAGLSPEDEDRWGKYQKAKKWAEFCERSVDRLDKPFKLVVFQLLFAYAYGVRLAEKTMEPGEGEDKRYLVLKSLKIKSNESWNFVVDPFGNVVSIRGLVYGGGIQDLPPAKFLIFTSLPRDQDPRGRSLLRQAYNPWNLKTNCLKFYFLYLDRFASPTRVGIAPPTTSTVPALDRDGKQIPGQSFTATQELLYVLQKLDNDSCAAVRNGTDIKFIQATTDGEPYIKAFTYFDTQIVQSILHAARSIMEAEHGSKADSEGASDWVKNLIEMLRGFTASAIEDQLFHGMLAVNAGEDVADEYCPSLDLGEVKNEDIATFLTACVSAGYTLDPQKHFAAIDSKIGLPIRDEVKPLEQPEDAVEEKPGKPEDAPVKLPNRTKAKPAKKPAKVNA